MGKYDDAIKEYLKADSEETLGHEPMKWYWYLLFASLCTIYCLAAFYWKIWDIKFGEQQSVISVAYTAITWMALIMKWFVGVGCVIIGAICLLFTFIALLSEGQSA
jgi:hypothetical protein